MKIYSVRNKTWSALSGFTFWLAYGGSWEGGTRYDSYKVKRVIKGMLRVVKLGDLDTLGNL